MQCNLHGDCYNVVTELDLYDFEISWTNIMFDIFKLEYIFLGVYCIFGVILAMSLNRSICSKNSNECLDSEDSQDHVIYNKSKWPYKSDKVVPHDLEERMKFFENLSRQIEQIDSKYPFIVRIDGCSFSNFTNKLKKMSGQEVFVPEFYQAMLATACDLLIKFKPSVVYTHSDEITLIFGTQYHYNNDSIVTTQHYRNGKVYKLISEIPSSASTSFTRNILSKTSESNDLHEKLSEYLKHNDIAFDGRIVVFPLESRYEIANHMIWRTRDCYRNYVSAYSQKYLGKHKVNGVSTENRVRMLKNNNVDLNDEENLSAFDLGMKYGTFLKKFSSDKSVYSIQAFYSKRLVFSEELLDFLLCPMTYLKYKNEETDDDIPDLCELDENVDSVIKTEKQEPEKFALDLYKFEDVFNGTFQIEVNK